MNRLLLLQHYVFWLCWSVITGGIATVSLVAPLAFRTLPNQVSDPQQALLFSGKLFTMVFDRFFMVCLICGLILMLLEGLWLTKDLKRFKPKYWLSLHWLLMLAMNCIWAWLALWIVPAMSEMQAQRTGLGWPSADMRILFSHYHQLSTNLTKVAFVLVLLVPWLRLKRFTPHPHH